MSNLNALVDLCLHPDIPYWDKESYITQKTTISFSHGICPECLSKFYPNYDSNQAKQHDDTQS